MTARRSRCQRRRRGSEIQLTANTTRRRCTRNPFVLLRAAFAAAPASSYSVLVAGRTVGSYATPEEAETALHRLPYPQQQRATICDADGFCVAR